MLIRMTACVNTVVFFENAGLLSRKGLTNRLRLVGYSQPLKEPFLVCRSFFAAKQAAIWFAALDARNL